MNPALFFVTFMLAVATFIVVRLVIPGLVNLHNDVALLVALLLVPTIISVWWYFWVHVLKPLWKGDSN